MTFSIVRSEKHMTARDWAATAEDPGRPKNQLAGTYMGDLVALKKAIAVCDSCFRKWRPGQDSYGSKRNLPFVRGTCDGCGERFDKMRLFVHKAVAKDQ